MRVAAIVLAAGRGSRMGGPKAMLAWRGRPMLAAVCELFDRGSVSERIVVLGHEAERIHASCPLPPSVRTVVNHRHTEGMLSSILAGLETAEDLGADAVLLHPVDHPLLEEDTIDAVVSALERGAIIAVPSHGGRRGHPAGYARAAWAALRKAPPGEGARAVLAGHPEWIVHLPAGAGCLAGINTPADYARLVGLDPREPGR